MFPFLRHRHHCAVTSIEYYELNIVPGIRVAGEFEAITDTSSHIYTSLKKNGFALLFNCLKLTPKDVTILKLFLDKNKSSFNRLFTTFRWGGKIPVFLNENKSGQCICTESFVLDAVRLTYNIEGNLEKNLEIGRFPNN